MYKDCMIEITSITQRGTFYTCQLRTVKNKIKKLEIEGGGTN